MTYKILNRDEHFTNPEPKRILSLDGGGLRGILSLAMLLKLESILRQRYGNNSQFRLCHYFDLIAGTSTGAIIAAALAQGMSVSKIIEKYNDLGNKVFRRSLFRLGIIRALYAKKKLVSELKKVYGEDATLGSDQLKTGLLIVTKRLDSGSPWPLSNNPNGKYFGTREGSKAIANADYPLWQVVRASTAAPRYFRGEEINIIEEKGKKPVKGVFVDGGVSPFNNPALQAFMFSSLAGYRVNWETGADKLLLVSLGTGSRDPQVGPAFMEAENAIKSLVALMEDCSALVETMMQWMSSSTTARSIDGEIGSLQNDLLGGKPLFAYQRYNVELSDEFLREQLDIHLPQKQLKPLTEMDAPENMKILQSIGETAGEKLIQAEHFPAAFDLK